MSQRVVNNSRITVINRDGTDGPTYVWRNRDCLFGSSSDAHIIIDIPGVAEHHCMLYLCPDDRVKVIDMRGGDFSVKTLPTKLNGVPVDNFCYLPDRSLIDIGGRQFRFSYATTCTWSSVTDMRLIAVPSTLNVSKPMVESSGCVAPPGTGSIPSTPTLAKAQVQSRTLTPLTEPALSELLQRKIADASALGISPKKALSPKLPHSPLITRTTPASPKAAAKLVIRRALTTKERYGPTPTREELMRSPSPKTRVSRCYSATPVAANKMPSPQRRSSSGGRNRAPPVTSATSSCPAKRKQVSFGPPLSPEHFDKTLPPCTPLKRGARWSGTTRSSVTPALPTVHSSPRAQPEVIMETPRRASRVVSQPPTPDDNLLDSREKVVASEKRPSRKPSPRTTNRSSMPTVVAPRKTVVRSRSATTSPRRPLAGTPRAPPSTPIHSTTKTTPKLSEELKKRMQIERPSRRTASLSPAGKRATAGAASQTWAAVVKAKLGPVVSAVPTKVKAPAPPPRPKKRQSLGRNLRTNIVKTPLERYGAASSTGHALSPTPIIVKKRAAPMVGRKSGTPARAVRSSVKGPVHPRVLALKRKSCLNLNDKMPTKVLKRLSKVNSPVSEPNPVRNEIISEGPQKVITSPPKQVRNEIVSEGPQGITSPPKQVRNEIVSEGPQEGITSPQKQVRNEIVSKGPQKVITSPSKQENTSKKPVAMSPRLSGVRTLMRTPKRHSPELIGVRQLMKSPKSLQSPEMDGVKELLASPPPVVTKEAATPRGRRANKTSNEPEEVPVPRSTRKRAAVEEKVEETLSPRRKKAATSEPVEVVAATPRRTRAAAALDKVDATPSRAPSSSALNESVSSTSSRRGRSAAVAKKSPMKIVEESPAAIFAVPSLELSTTLRRQVKRTHTSQSASQERNNSASATNQSDKEGKVDENVKEETSSSRRPRKATNPTHASQSKFTEGLSAALDDSFTSTSSRRGRSAAKAQADKQDVLPSTPMRQANASPSRSESQDRGKAPNSTTSRGAKRTKEESPSREDNVNVEATPSKRTRRTKAAESPAVMRAPPSRAAKLKATEDLATSLDSSFTSTASRRGRSAAVTRASKEGPSTRNNQPNEIISAPTNTEKPKRGRQPRGATVDDEVASVTSPVSRVTRSSKQI